MTIFSMNANLQKSSFEGWQVKSIGNSMFPRLRNVRIMYASSENAAREAFIELKELMGSDAQRAVSCIEKNLDSLLVHYRFIRDRDFLSVIDEKLRKEFF